MDLASGRWLRPSLATRILHTAGLRCPIHAKWRQECIGALRRSVIPRFRTNSLLTFEAWSLRRLYLLVRYCRNIGPLGNEWTYSIKPCRMISSCNGTVRTLASVLTV